PPALGPPLQKRRKVGRKVVVTQVLPGQSALVVHSRAALGPPRQRLKSPGPPPAPPARTAGAITNNKTTVRPSTRPTARSSMCTSSLSLRYSKLTSSRGARLRSPTVATEPSLE